MDSIHGTGVRGMGEIELTSADRTVSRCVVCGSREVRTDEVLQRGWVLLAECPHCDHRWTCRGGSRTAPTVVRSRVHGHPELAQLAEVSSAA